ncbi:MAG: TIGR03013 family PEP-CTERM/XrtA system glycosyltransferase [Acidobacteriota bacterium]|nr:TIGR03013 family PEP-CTERM/XrtA system glycosyltransferase [Acidobacteriota bacterium]
MLSVMNRYVPGRVFVLLVVENTLLTFGIVCAAAFTLHQHGHEFAQGSEWLLRSWCISAIFQISFYYFDLYDLRAIANKWVLLGRLTSAVGAACLAMAVVVALFPPARLGIGVMETTSICLALVILLGRMSLEWVNRWMTAGEPILLLGNGNMAASLAREILWRTDLPLRLLGAVSEPEFEDTIANVCQLGPIDELERIIKEQSPKRIVIAMRERRRRMPLELLLRAKTQGIQIEEAATLFEKLTGRIPVETIYPSTLIYSKGFSKQSTLSRFLARFTSAAVALVGLIVTAPVMLLTALVVRLDSPGPVLYSQERVGKNGRTFKILKFRSMRIDAEANGAQWSAENDPRITRVGRFIRGVRLDELPQFINILRGEMNLVGPRPERPYFVQLLTGKIPYYDLRHTVPPGVTGWAQVSYPYGSTVEDAKNKLEYDLFYVKNASLALDLAILFETVRTVLWSKGR